MHHESILPSKRRVDTNTLTEVIGAQSEKRRERERERERERWELKRLEGHF